THMNDQLIMLLCIAGAVALVGFFVVQIVLNRGTEGKLRSRLTGGGIETRRKGGKKATVKELIQELGQKAAKPFMPENADKQVVIRRSLARAGIYTPSAIRMVQGSKVILTIVGIILGYVAGV